MSNVNNVAKVALALDIDGVFLRGKSVLNGAKNAMKKINKAKIPHVFITNGGGTKEFDKAKQLSELLDCNINENQILMSHTPFKEIDIAKSKKSLIIGNETCIEVAKSYGFKDPWSVRRLLATDINMYPFHQNLCSNNSNNSNSCNVVESREEQPCDFGSAFIFYDSPDWSVDFQILSDVLLGGTPLGDMSSSSSSSSGSSSSGSSSSSNRKQKIPLYGSNADIVFSSTYPHNRFTQGSFIHAFSSLWYQYTHEPLDVTMIGKPYSSQYRYCEHLLNRHGKTLGIKLNNNSSNNSSNNSITTIYGIGDNPKADIRGVNNARTTTSTTTDVGRYNWQSILVCSGVYSGGPESNDKEDPADHVLVNIDEAIDYILEKHSL